MKTQEIADRLVVLCRQGEYETAYRELYHPDIISIEAAGTDQEKRVQGMDAIAKKGEQRNDMMEEFISGWVSDPLVAGDYITMTMWFTCVYTWQTEQSQESEVCVYQVHDGKIIKEMFFYDEKM